MVGRVEESTGLSLVGEMVPTVGRSRRPGREEDEPRIPPALQQRGMLAVSRAVARSTELGPILDRIAREAARAAGTPASSVLLARANRLVFRLGGSYGLSADYRRRADCAEVPLSLGKGPSGVAIVEQRAVIVDDTEGEPTLAPWSDLARREGYRALVSTPLMAGGRALGALNVYRRRPGAWRADQIEMLAFFAEHAASAIRVAQLVQRQGKQLEALEQLMSGLHEQTHEYANRIHALRGLLELDRVDQARRLVAIIEDEHHASYGALVARIGNATLAGLIQAHMGLARKRQVELRLDLRSHLEVLPDGLSELEAVTVVGNLIENALDAVADLPPSRRRITLGLYQRPRETVFSVRDFGRGVPEPLRAAIFERRASTKPGHTGVGLALVRDVALGMAGEVTLSSTARGTRVEVRIPHAG